MNRVDLPWIRTRISRHEPRPISDKVASRRAAVAAIFRDRTDGIELLFIQRAKMEQDPWSGHMAFPGGQTEKRDSSPLHTARRETKEEVGVDLETAGQTVGQLDDIIASAGGRVVPMAITPFVFELLAPVEPDLDQREVEEVVWVPVTMLLDLTYASTVPYEIAGQRFHLPCFRVFNRVIWGLTYQMLMRMFTVLDWEPGR